MRLQIPGCAIVAAVIYGILGADVACARAQDVPDQRQSLADFLPVPPTVQNGVGRLPLSLADVPEVHFQQPLTKATNAKLHIKFTIDKAKLLNEKKPDAFMEALLSKRADLAGLSFVMGDACRVKEAAREQFVVAMEDARRAQSAVVRDSNNDEIPAQDKMKYHRETGEGVDPSARVAALMQLLGPESADTRLSLVKYLDGVAHADAAGALAKLAIFSEEPEVRSAALRALKMRRDRDYADILLAGLKYPWPAVAERASEAIAKLGRSDLVPHLMDVLEGPDPRAPQIQDRDGKKVSVVRELVRINHHHNCLLCHAPANHHDAANSKEDSVLLARLTAEMPVPGESMTRYYRPNNPDILVRFDVTYLRQDFSVKLPVADADPWPQMQRYDFLVRTREVSDQEAGVHRQLLQPSQAEGMSPYHRAALSALRQLTGGEMEPKAAAWR